MHFTRMCHSTPTPLPSIFRIQPTSHPNCSSVLSALRAIYLAEYHYKKAGVELNRIVSLPVVQPDLYGEVSLPECERQGRLMAIVDAINRIYGRDTLMFAVQGITRNWKMRQGKLSGRYLSRWDELPTLT